MKAVNQIPAIAEAIASGRNDLFNAKAYDKITDDIFWAWENWEEKFVATFYTGEKPAEPTYEFRKQWVQNELDNVPENWDALIKSFSGYGYTLDNNTGSFTVPKEIAIHLDGQDMLNMGWEIGGDSPETQYELRVTDSKITASILAANGEYSDSGFSFEYIESVQDLIRHGHLMIADDDGNEAESGTLQIKP